MRSRSLRRPAIALLVLLTAAACGSAGTTISSWNASGIRKPPAQSSESRTTLKFS